jgi:ubiquinone biosynthesis protein
MNPRASANAVVDTINRVVNVVGASANLVSNVLVNSERLVADVVGDSAAVARESEALYASAAEGASAVREAVRATPRFSRVVSELLRLVAAYRVHEFKARALSPAAAERALQKLHERSAERLYALCIELRGGVLKVGQFASSRMDLLPEPYIVSLARLQDSVPAIPLEAIAERVEQELGAPLDQLFERFDAEPLAAASLAQVHEAVPRGETRSVAVKVQVPQIEQTVEIDLAALKVMAGVVQDAIVPHLDLRTVATELERSVVKELDYEREARVAAQLAQDFAGNDRVIVPRVVEALSSKRVLTMDLVQGQRLVKYLEAQVAAGPVADRKGLDQLFETLIRTTCAQVLEHGLFQADPHPGNYLVVEGETQDAPVLALLDFGAFTPFPDELRRDYAALAAAILTRDHDQVTTRLRELGFATRDGSEETLLRFSEMLMDTFRPDPTVSLDDLDPREAFEEALALARANPVQVPGHFVLLGRVFAALGGLLLRYRPQINLFVLLAPYLAPVMASAAAAPAAAKSAV